MPRWSKTDQRVIAQFALQAFQPGLGFVSPLLLLLRPLTLWFCSLFRLLAGQRLSPQGLCQLSRN